MSKIKFKLEEKVYQVRCGDVKVGHVAQMWELPDSDKEMGYSVRGGFGDCFWNPDIGVTVFKKLADAVQVAAEFIATHDCILARDMEFVERQDFEGTNYHKIPQTFGVFSDGKMYIDSDYQFAHIVDYGDVWKAKDALYEIRKGLLSKGIKEVPPTAKLNNVYACNDISERKKGELPWIYSEVGYSGIIKTTKNGG